MSDDDATAATIASLRRRVGTAEAEAHDLRAELAAVRSELLALAEFRALEAYTHEQYLLLEATAEERDALVDELEAARARVDELESSTSWRVTGPVRWIGSFLRGR